MLEVAGTTCMKLSEGFAKFGPTVLLVLFYSLSFGSLTLCLKKLEVSTAYAIWSGLGTTIIALIGIAYFKEPLSWLKAFSIALIVAGVMLLNLEKGWH